MYIDGLNEEFKPSEDSTNAATSGHLPAQRPDFMEDPEDRPVNVLDPETEARVKANHERFMKAAPVPGQLSGEALEAQGFTVRRVE